MAFDSILVLKTGALGDVLRTTSILPGLREAHPAARIVWCTAHGALPLVEHHPLVDEAFGIDPRSDVGIEAAARELASRRIGWLLSFDDEEPLCRLASAIDCERLSGAYIDGRGARAYTDDVAPWFDMGLLSVHGKAAADRMKLENERSHPAIFAEMLGVTSGLPELPLESALIAAARARVGARGRGPLVGLNTGAGGRWKSKQLTVERTLEFARELSARLGNGPTFLVLGGLDEAERNAEISAGLGALEAEGAGLHVIDGGTENGLLEFAALVDACDLLLSSDSLALHVAVARRVPLVAFFAPTSAAEIELYGLGEKVVSTAPDAGSYKPDVDTSTLTSARLVAAAVLVLTYHPAKRRT